VLIFKKTEKEKTSLPLIIANFVRVNWKKGGDEHCKRGKGGEHRGVDDHIWGGKVKRKNHWELHGRL